MNLYEELSALLARSGGEREIAAFLKKNPDLVFWTFLPVGGHYEYVVPEFQLGAHLRADFVLLQSYSGGWHIHLVELEPVNDPIYNKNGLPSKRLRAAQKQIADWRQHKDTEGPSLRIELARAARKSGGLDMDLRDAEPSSFSSQKLRDPLTHINWNYHIVIGRRDTLSEHKNSLRTRNVPYDGIDIATYDRFLDVARKWSERGNQE